MVFKLTNNLESKFRLQNLGKNEDTRTHLNYEQHC